MAGATNRALKAAGLPKATQAQIRVARGAGLTVQSAIQHAQAHGLPLGKAKTAGELTGWQKAAAGVKATPAERKAALVRPGTERMQASKANVATLRAQRDARRENMQRMRKRAEFSRETKQLRAAFTPEHQRAIDKAEMGHGPKHAKTAARASLLDAKASVRDARKAVEAAHNSIKFGQEAAMMRKPNGPGAEVAVRAHQFLRDAANARRELAPVGEHLARANMARTAARQQRRHATLVNEGRALREMADANHPLTRRGAKADFGFSGVSKPAGRSTIGKYGAFNSARHLAKRIALGEQLAQRVINANHVGKNGARFMRNLDAIKRIAPKKSADPKVNARERMRAEYNRGR